MRLLKSITIFLLLFLPLGGQVHAFCFEGGAEALFLRPWTEDLFFTIKGPNLKENPNVFDTPIGQELAIDSNYEPGFAVWLGMGLCDCGHVGLRWERLHTSATRTERLVETQRQALWVTRGSPEIGTMDTVDDGFVRSRAHFDYDRVDLSFGWDSYHLCPGVLEPSIGVSYLELFYSNHTRYEDLNDPRVTIVHDWARSWGVGPYAEVGGFLPLCFGIGVEGALRGSLFVGQVRAATAQAGSEGGDPEGLLRDQREYVCRKIPHLGFSVGLRYIWQCGCAKVTLRGGYRADRYLHALQGIRFTERNTGTTTFSTRNSSAQNALQLTGFYVGGSISY